MLTDVTEELWTGRGAEVLVGKNISKILSASTRDRDFQDMFLQKLFDEGMLEDDEDGLQITGVDMCSLKRSGKTGYHELEINYSVISDRLPGKPLTYSMGVEFNPIEGGQERFRLRMFPKVKNTSGQTVPIALEQNPDLPQQVTQGIRLGYWLLEKTGYVKE
ncbi:MAG: hypothetical protein U9Q06_03950 [Nanoarchaeota archaeon]|nr:hypothetical protein [Nanoarchaeota archaeon]